MSVRAPQRDAVEVLLTLSPEQYRELGEDIEAVRVQLDLPPSTPPDDVIRQAMHKLARSG